MLNNQARLLIGFFQDAIQVGEVEPDPARYLKRFRSEIKATGRLFEYLGLAKPDKQSSLGWKPTDRLLDLIAKSKVRPSKPASKSASLTESLILDLMLETVLGAEADSFHCYVMTRLGLVIEHTEGEWTPAPLLLKLFADTGGSANLVIGVTSSIPCLRSKEERAGAT
jgi:hypothetical protein